MEILLWLVPAVVATIGAMVFVAAMERVERSRESQARSEAQQEKFARAIMREHPASSMPRNRPVRDRSTGIAVRRPGGATTGSGDRRSA